MQIYVDIEYPNKSLCSEILKSLDFELEKRKIEEKEKGKISSYFKTLTVIEYQRYLIELFFMKLSFYALLVYNAVVSNKLQKICSHEA